MPLCQYCRHLNPVGNDRCAKCHRWIGLGPEPATPAEEQRPVAAEAPLEVQPLAATPEASLENHVREVLRREGKIEAIKWYRQATGIGLAEAKAVVDAIEGGRGLATGASSDDEMLLVLLRANRKIEAIRVHRQRTGQGLSEAKRYVESLGLRHGIRPAAGCGSAAMVLLGTITGVAAMILVLLAARG